MTLNPIIAREFRVRWRSWGAPGLVLLLLAGLALAMGAAYADQVHAIQYRGGSAAQGAGRGIFTVLAFIQIGAWLLLAPILTSMNLAAERERGLLEGLQLSPLRASQIAGGKLFSALAFIGVVTLTTLPVTGITFLMGGVSPREFMGASGLNLLTALTGASIGLFFSARCRRPLPALFLSLGAVAAWFFGGYIFFALSHGFFYGAVTPSAWSELGSWALFLNPMVSLWTLINPRDMTGVWPAPGGSPDFPYWSIFPWFSTALSLLCLWGTARAVKKPFEPAYPNDRHWLSFAGRRRKRVSRAVEGSAGQAGISPLDAAPLEARLLHEIRLDQWVHFSNPVLQREVRGPLRFRRAKAWQGILQLTVATFLLGLFAFYTFCTIDDPSSHRDIWGLFINVWLFGVVLTSAVWGARSLAREKENGLSEGLTLSLLTPREIIRAKLLAPLIVIGLYSLPVLFVLSLSVDWLGSYNASVYDLPLPAAAALGAFLIAVSTAYCILTFGLYISFRSARVTNAVIVVLVSLIIVWAIGPAFMESILAVWCDRYDSYRYAEVLRHLTHPFVAINDLDPRPGPYGDTSHRLLWSWSYILVATTLGAVFYTLLLTAMQSRSRLKQARNPISEATP